MKYELIGTAANDSPPMYVAAGVWWLDSSCAGASFTPLFIGCSIIDASAGCISADNPNTAALTKPTKIMTAATAVRGRITADV